MKESTKDFIIRNIDLVGFCLDLKADLKLMGNDFPTLSKEMKEALKDIVETHKLHDVV